MVKVLKCHHFKSQNIIQTLDEPVAICSYKEKVFVATASHTVEVFSLKPGRESDSQSDKSPVNVICFSTESLVQQIKYCSTGNYICTLECKTARKVKFYSVKVYLNWHLLTRDGQQLTRVRIAGQSKTVRSQNPEEGCLTVIDVPFLGTVRAIAICHESGNMAVAFDNKIQIFCLTEKTIGTSDSTYLDIIMFLELQWDFTVQKLALCEENVVAASASEVQVVKITYSDGSQTSRQLSKSIEDTTLPEYSFSIDNGRSQRFASRNANITPEIWFSESGDHFKFSNFGNRSSLVSSPALSNNTMNTSKSVITTSSIVDDENFITWKFGEVDNFQTKVIESSFADASSTLSTGSFTRQASGNRNQSKTICLKGLQDLAHELNYAEPPKATDFRGGSHITIGEVSVTTLLYQRCNLSEESWEHVQLIPTYLSYNHGIRLHDVLNSCPMNSASFGSLVGCCCFVSGSRVGHMYTLSSHPTEISHYRYTSDAQQVICDSSLLYVVTDTGLEMYTARCNVAAIHNMENFNNVTKAFPSMDIETCLCGVHPFIGAREITLTQDHVILLTRYKDGKNAAENVWNLYSLEKCSVADMYRDMIAFGAKFQNFGPDTYLHLLEEALMMVRSAMVGVSDNSLQDLVQEATALLGDFYSVPGCDDWALCLPYYMMSGLNAGDVVRQAIQFKQHNRQPTPYSYGRGLLLYLNHVLFLDEEPFDLKETECDRILDLMFDADPAKIPSLIIFSRVQNYTPEKALSLLRKCRKQKKIDSEENICVERMALTIVHLKLCDPDSALESLTSLPQKELIGICSGHHQLLHQDFVELSPLSQLMRRHCPAVLIKCLVALHDQGTVHMDLAIQLLQGSYVEENLHRNDHVKAYLEALLEDQTRKYIFEEGATVLCKIYIRRLAEWKPPVARQLCGPQHCHLTKGSGHFGHRYSWLDHVPPFHGAKSIQQPCIHLTPNPSSFPRVGIFKGSPPTASKHGKPRESCSCYLCNEDLIRFQSLLSSDFTTIGLVDTALQMVQNNGSIHGEHSIKLLCLLHKDLDKCFDSVVNMYPSILPDFALSVIGSDYGKWKQFLTCLMVKLREEAQTPTGKEMVYSSALQGVLLQLCGLVSATDFLRLLPDDGNFIFFLPFIKLSFEKQQSKKIKKHIIDKGEELRQMT